ncbi:NAD-dependent succinate-semialdehyde dehydrogenase [Henriciella sp.]|uniref:NAD-dependent succinate-semialdehyde dehydrogenase n=1 Tax=Henriciella sp. TaxID=1968823 RepID=UPI002602F2A7|nr:NAD-dependent succinate-semialdehyde dehydrogenase [Henriciella sp.]
MSLTTEMTPADLAGANPMLRKIIDRIEARKPSKTFAVHNPANDALIADVPDESAAATEKAVTAATRAQPEWAGLTAKDRCTILRRWHDLIMTHADDLAAILTLEQGKPVAEAHREVTFGATYIEWFAEEAKRAYGDVIPTSEASRLQLVIKQPVGVVGAITPWNFPSGMITRKAAPALAAGCTIVLKPSEETPLSALALELLAEEAGFPEGVFQVVTSKDPAAVAGVLTGDPRIRKISFTGSTRVGKLLMGQSAETVKRLSLELGGNAPLIVFDDADIDAAVAGAIAAKFRNAGQTCVCANRILLHASIKGEFLDKFIAAAKAMNVSDGFDPACDMGPMINSAAKQKTRALIEDAIAKGAELSTSGKEMDKGNFLPPIILSGVTNQMDITHTEIFGPVAPIFTFETEEEAVKLANDTPYGLAAYFWTRGMARARRVAEQLEAGMIGLNENAISSAATPFGGIKESGLGREGSRYGLDDYLDIKYIAIGGL